jgi:hypothetical protein
MIIHACNAIIDNHLHTTINGLMETKPRVREERGERGEESRA